ncbi:MAG TPA: lipid II flippase Amj family protein [Terriglobia bacterium]|nr:lipid II flippase Amj family protein [Terriglobia bacterium]
MDKGLLLIFVLTFVIHLIGTLAYSVRIAGTRTRRIAISLSLFNILVLVSRTSNSFAAPLLAKRVEQNIAHGFLKSAATDFRWLLLSATLASIAGGICIPTFQRLFARYVDAFARHRSVFRVFLRAFSPASVVHVRESVHLPDWKNISRAHRGSHIPWSVVLWNMVAMAIWTVGVFSALYAAYIRPDLRVTSSELSAIINGVATIVMFMFIDPYLSMLTDEVAEGKVTEPYFRRSIVWLTGSRVLGTLAAQLLLIPAAFSIVAIAEWL